MYSPTQQQRYMGEALVEGRKALPACLPNPPVGCVLLRGSEIVARGYTQPPGRHHAEAMALSQLAGELERRRGGSEERGPR
jgi:pyrimidine deaminase RibD-like protein